jgi:hypothetical protein
VVALAKYVWATTSYGGQPSVEVFAKHYCLHWQKRKIGHKIAQFGSCTFTPKTGKTSMEVVELVPCARNKWGNWWEFWFYVSKGTVEDHSGLPVAVMCSHYYAAYPQFEVAEDDENEGALRCAARMSSGRDLVEEFVGYGVWPLAHGWALGEVCPRQMPSRCGMLVRSPAFALDLHGRDPAAFVREAEDGAARIVGRYVPKTEGLRSWDIRGTNDRLNRVFELNRLPNGGYPGEDAADRRGKKPMGGTEEGPLQEAAPATKKRKLGTIVRENGVSDNFVVELMGTCAPPPGGRMSSPELRESSARMLEVTGGRWPKNLPIPWAEREDMSTSRIARGLKIFPYGQNIAVVVSAVMNKDRQDAAQKRRAVVRLPDPRREAKRARGSAKAAAAGSSQPTLAAKLVAPGSSMVSESAKVVAAGGTKSTQGEAAKVRELPSPGKRVADFGTNISVDDYFVGKYFFGPVVRCRVRRGSNGCCPACGGNHDVNRGGRGEGWRFLRKRRDFVGRCRQGRGGHHVPPVEGGVAAAVAAAKSSKLSWTSMFAVFMGIVVSCVSVRRPTSSTAWRRVPSLQMCMPKSRDFGRSTRTPSGRSRLRRARAAGWRRRWPPWRPRGRTSGASWWKKGGRSTRLLPRRRLRRRRPNWRGRREALPANARRNHYRKRINFRGPSYFRRSAHEIT